jgi:hypothetical protein
MLERRGRHVVALIDDDQTVSGGQIGHVLTAREGLQGHHVYAAAAAGSAGC